MNTLQQLIDTVKQLQKDISSLKKENLQLSNKLKQATDISDTRSENYPPSYYRKKGVGIYREFKHRWVIDINSHR
jgi:conjugal transfer/entry exclusion protein